MATETVSMTAMRPRLSELLSRAREHFDRFIITRRGRAEAVLLSADEFEGLLETLEILSDKSLVKRLIEADEQLSRGATPWRRGAEPNTRFGELGSGEAITGELPDEVDPTVHPTRAGRLQLPR